MPFIDSSNLVLVQEFLLVFLRARFHGELIKIGIKFVLFELDFTVVSNSHACLLVAEDLVLLDLGEAGARHDDAAPLVLVDLVV